MHIVYRAENLFDAHLVKDALEADGIPAFIAGEYLTGAVGQLPAMDYMAVMFEPGGCQRHRERGRSPAQRGAASDRGR